MRYCFGVDVGGTTVKLGFFDEEGNLLEKWEIPTRTQDNGQNILPDVAASILDKMKEREVSERKLPVWESEPLVPLTRREPFMWR